LKVRGFQVAPAELEGHLLSHADVADSCVVGVPDDFSGEVPLAFVVLSADAAKRASEGPAAAAKIKASIAKVCCFVPLYRDCAMTDIVTRSSLRIIKSHTRSWLVAWSSLMLSRRTPVESC